MEKTIDKVLFNGTTAFIDAMETPCMFLGFLTDSISWLEDLAKNKNTQADSFASRVIIDKVVQPWFSCNGNAEQAVSDGWGEVALILGHGGYLQYLSELIMGYGIFLQDSGMDPFDYLYKITAMSEMSDSFLLRR